MRVGPLAGISGNEMSTEVIVGVLCQVPGTFRWALTYTTLPHPGRPQWLAAGVGGGGGGRLVGGDGGGGRLGLGG